MELLKRSGVEVAGKRAVVLGRSNIVGIPISYLLLNANATVTICHSRTKDVDEICRQADILVAAIGQPEYVKKEWVKPGAVIIDVGINSVPDSTKKSGCVVP
jgi:methylenetetrahydrofolate dehydrogenase (NADP+)/methenyltetrahydrofolate cyclohydrolase/formyltetrahydrofolate synthetase